MGARGGGAIGGQGGGGDGGVGGKLGAGNTIRPICGVVKPSTGTPNAADAAEALENAFETAAAVVVAAALSESLTDAVTRTDAWTRSREMEAGSTFKS